MPVCYLHMWVSMHACLYRSQKTTSGTFLYHDPHFVRFSRQCLTMESWLSQNSVRRPVRPWTLRNLAASASRMLRIKGMHHDDQLSPYFWNQDSQWTQSFSIWQGKLVNDLQLSPSLPRCPHQHQHWCESSKLLSSTQSQDLHACKVELKTRHQPQKGEKMMHYLY